MPNDPLLAHSPRNGVPAQTYLEHVTNVHCRAVRNARYAIDFYSGDGDLFVGWVNAAALYHDLGKVDAANQQVLRRQSREPLPIAHEDAGVAELDRLCRNEAVALAAAHHAGLFSRKDDVLATQGRPFREIKRSTPAGTRVADHVDQQLDTYKQCHQVAGCPTLDKVEPTGLQGCGFTRRLALSCLVDADHGDTARNYGREITTPAIETRWAERAAALQRYVEGLPEGRSDRERERNRLRNRIFESCRDADLEPRIRACDAPVGSGKTTAVMAHLLRVAAARNPQLRHIFVVLPYTNIITQAVEVYRKALVLEGEKPEDVVAEHHHRADFEDLDLRQLATLWKAPIIATTAVQFFETLGNHHPARLRKLHELPGSAVFVDETHAAIPSHLWPQVWRWLETWTHDWGGHLVLGSGSLPRFWELPEYRDVIRSGSDEPLPNVPDLVNHELQIELRDLEKRRVRYCRRPEKALALDCSGLIEFVQRMQGPRLLIVNTVQTAAVIARAMRQRGDDVLHLSTALAPAHRNLVVQRVKQRLRYKIDTWTLVATTCVESGMDFSFRTGFRERASTSSLLQISGRVSRGAEYEDAEIWDLLLQDDLFRSNPAIEVARRVLDGFKEGELNSLSPVDLATSAMKREWTCGAEEKARELIAAEVDMEYPKVATLARVIDADTRMVVIDPGLAESIRKGRKISKTELLNYSVQMWAYKIDYLKLERIGSQAGSDPSQLLYAWGYGYDADFLGYMAGGLGLAESLKDGVFLA